MLMQRSTSDVSMSDYYCGAGGSSTGAIATGAVRVAMAVNHWDLAIETHSTNHPDTDHDKADINKADPKRYPRTAIGWFSPECTYWSSARGERLPDGQLAWDFFGDSLPDEAADRSRMGMWDVPRFSAHHLYDIVIVENVPRVVKGVHWNRWLRSMRDIGYLHEVLWLNSMHAQGLGDGAPQSRDRVYVVFWRAGNPRPDFESWVRPQAVCPEHGLIQSAQVMKPKGSPMKTYGAQYTLRCPHTSCNTEVFPAVAGADTIIDRAKRGIRIGDRKKLGMDELADKTLQRIFHGVKRHWVPAIIEAAGNTYDATSPRHPQHGDPDAYYRVWPADEPLRTLHTTASKGLIVRGEGNTTPAKPVETPIGAITAAGSQFLVTPPLVVPYRSGSMPRPVGDPLPTMTTVDAAALLVPVEGRAGKVARPASTPLRTQSTRNETGLLEPTPALSNDEIWQMVYDAEFRMLEPGEIKRGMAFPGTYVLLGNKREQVRMAGNAVTPNAARDIIAACVESLGYEVHRAWGLAA